MLYGARPDERDVAESSEDWRRDDAIAISARDGATGIHPYFAAPGPSTRSYQLSTEKLKSQHMNVAKLVGIRALRRCE